MYLCSCAIVVRNVKSLITNHKMLYVKLTLRGTVQRLSASAFQFAPGRAGGHGVP